MHDTVILKPKIFNRRFPDFSYVTTDEPLTEYIDAVIISHFHLDHCGALPYMTEMVGYNGPIYMTVPTKVQKFVLFYFMVGWNGNFVLGNCSNPIGGYEEGRC